MTVTVNGHTYYDGVNDLELIPKPIRVRWENSVFRSAEEARWDVIFDRLDLVRVYEPQGIELKRRNEYGMIESIWYTPDYYFKESRMLVDVKRDGEQDSTVDKENLQAALHTFNDPDDIYSPGYKGVYLEGQDKYPIDGLLITPAKVFLNYPEEESDEDYIYHGYHEKNRFNEKRLYDFILTLMGIDVDDKRFQQWSVNNPNFEHIRRAMLSGMSSFFDHGQSPPRIGFRNGLSDDELLEYFGEVSLNDNNRSYLWDYFDSYQIKQLIKLSS